MNALRNSTAMQPGAGAFERPAAKPEPLIPDAARNVFVRLPTVQAMRGGISVSAVYEDMKRGLWPRPITVSRRLVVWLLDECDRLIAAQAAGKSEAEIRALVVELTEARKHRV